MIVALLFSCSSSGFDGFEFVAGCQLFDADICFCFLIKEKHNHKGGS